MEVMKVLEINEDFESVLICAERYATGRRTYMPDIVVDYIKRLIPQLSDKTLTVIRNDITERAMYGSLGDPKIDAPLWIGLLDWIAEELERRKT